jgi:predicted Zn-dependent peptidase
MLFKGTPTVGTTDYQAELGIQAAQDRVFETLRRARWAARGYERRREAVPDSLTARITVLEAAFDSLQVAEREVVLSEEISRIYTRNGVVDDNASTGYDGTQYYLSLPANRLELWARMVADQMETPVFREFFAERDVVIEERRRAVETQPTMTLYEQVIGTAFIAHPYQIMWEWESEVANITRAELYEFYRRYYGPNRAVLGIVGDIDIAETVALTSRSRSSSRSPSSTASAA